MKICRTCKISKNVSEFYTYNNGTVKPDCKTCANQISYKKEKINDRYTARRIKFNDTQKIRRKDPKYFAKFLLKGSKDSDNRLGRVNDFSEEFVESLISQPCCYCGDITLKMTLDRIDNSIGHLQSNVVPACIRCNYLRRDMPYIAWYHLLPAIRSARENGLFGDWLSKAFRGSNV